MVARIATRASPDGTMKVRMKSVMMRPGRSRADAQHDRIGEPARAARLAGDAPQQQGRKQEPGGIVGEAAENHVETHDVQRPPPVRVIEPSSSGSRLTETGAPMRSDKP